MAAIVIPACIYWLCGISTSVLKVKVKEIQENDNENLKVEKPVDRRRKSSINKDNGDRTFCIATGSRDIISKYIDYACIANEK